MPNDEIHRYEVTILIESEDWDASRVLDMVQDWWEDYDGPDGASPLCAEAVDKGTAVTVEAL